MLETYSMMELLGIVSGAAALATIAIACIVELAERDGLTSWRRDR